MNFRSLRKEKNLSQAELARMLGIDQTTVSKWEKGIVLPETKTLIALAEIFDVSVDYLLGRTSFYFPDKLQWLLDISDEEKEILMLFRKLTPQIRAHELKTLRIMAGELHDS